MTNLEIFFTAVVVSIAALFLRKIHLAARQLVSARLLEQADRALKLQEAEYAAALALSCRNYRSVNDFVPQSLLRINELLLARREELQYARELVERGKCTEERLAELLATAWNDEIGQRVREIKTHFSTLYDDRVLRVA